MGKLTKTTHWKKIDCDLNVPIFERCKFALGLHGDRYIAVAGGFYSPMMYDVRSDTIQPLPDTRNEFNIVESCGVILKGTFYVVRKCWAQSMWCIDLSTKSRWYEVQLPVGTFEPRLIANENDLFLFGEKSNFLYNPLAREWSKLPTISQYLINNAEKFKWIQFQDIIKSTYAYSHALVGDNIYIIGGFQIRKNYDITLSSVEIFNTSSMQWSEAPPLPIPLEDAATAVVGKHIIVSGGKTINNVNTSIFIFNTETKIWSRSKCSLPSPRILHNCVTIGDQFFSVGGCDHQFRSNGKYFGMESIHLKHLIPDFNWDRMGYLILLRKLVSENRAEIGPRKNREQMIINSCFKRVDDDLFREVLSFLF